jgi:hypothetical protein
MEIWCIDDLANTKGESGAKVIAMDAITKYGPAPGGVVAFGTAGYPDLASNDGCGTIGGTIFIHDAANDVAGYQGGSWAWSGFMGTLVRSKTPASFFSSVAADQKTLGAISLEMIAPQNHPAVVLQLIIAPDAVGISSVNIPYIPGNGAGAAYCSIDTTAIKQAQTKGATNITSVETTHGVIRSMWHEAPFSKCRWSVLSHTLSSEAAYPRAVPCAQMVETFRFQVRIPTQHLPIFVAGYKRNLFN